MIKIKIEKIRTSKLEFQKKNLQVLPTSEQDANRIQNLTTSYRCNPGSFRIAPNHRLCGDGENRI